jgi:hypothetical protein
MENSINRSHQFGETISVGSYEISPITRLIELRNRRIPFRLRWMTPAAIRVRHPDGRIEKIDIPDPTRWIQIGLLVGVVGMSVAMLVGSVVGFKRRGAGQ